MGLKSGSRDAGLDESDEDDAGDSEPSSSVSASETTGEADSPAPSRPANGPAAPEGSAGREESTGREESAGGDESGDESGGDADGTERPTMASLPYKLRREKVNEDREQVPFFLREAVVDGEDDLQATLEELLGEDVYKSDYREAAMVVAQRNPELVAAVLREWGYDLD